MAKPHRTFVTGQQLTGQDAFYINSELDQLHAEIADSAAREADLRNRAEVAEAKLRDDDETVNYHVWKVEDGHSWKQSQWPSLREAGQCDLCTAPEHLHMQANERCGETIPGYPTPENPTKIRRCNKLKNHPGRHGWIGGP